MFRQIVGDYKTPPPVAVPAGMPAAEAVGRIAGAEASAVVVVDARGGIIGILIERVVARQVARSGPDAVVDAAMTLPRADANRPAVLEK